ncbi:hypothetical protein ACWCPF_43265 [Streptomyces sp. NPDC001858]
MGSHVTTPEPFFDLVYVIPLTRVTTFMAHEHSGAGLLGMTLGMAGAFVFALTVPEAWHDAPGRLSGPVVLSCACPMVRCVHLVLYGYVARGDNGLRRKVRVSWPPYSAAAPS